MEYKENTIVELPVVRESELGAFLDAGTGNTSDDILLHLDQQTSPVRIGETVKVFLYHDIKGRLTASMRLPRIRPGQIGYVTVINRTSFGAFVDVGTERGIFLPFAEMRGNLQEGDNVWVKIYEDKSGRLAASMDVDEEMNLLAKPAIGLKRGDMVTLAIYNIAQEGALGITPQKHIVFIHKSDWTRHLFVGEKIDARITYIREDGRVNASMRKQKEDAITDDANAIYKYLQQRGGKMAYTDKTDADVVRRQFGISKSAFKRALGYLMRQGLVNQDEHTTYLCSKEKEES